MKTCILILDNIRSVENAGSIFRTADGLGVEKIYLIGTTPTPLDRFGRKRADFAKVSLGAEESVPWEYRSDIEPLLIDLKAKSYQILSLEQHERSVPLQNFKPKDLFVLVLGNEVDGVSEQVLKMSDELLEIPMKGEKESFNVSVSAGIALYTLLQ